MIPKLGSHCTWGSWEVVERNLVAKEMYDVLREYFKLVFLISLEELYSKFQKWKQQIFKLFFQLTRESITIFYNCMPCWCNTNCGLCENHKYVCIIFSVDHWLDCAVRRGKKIHTYNEPWYLLLWYWESSNTFNQQNNNTNHKTSFIVNIFFLGMRIYHSNFKWCWLRWLKQNDLFQKIQEFRALLSMSIFF